jgi:hypothetical protein
LFKCVPFEGSKFNFIEYHNGERRAGDEGTNRIEGKKIFNRVDMK